MPVHNYVDIRVERPGAWDWIDQFRNLLEINFQPLAAGPEVELTFTVSSRGGAGELEDIKTDISKAVEDHTGRSVLAARVRDWGEYR